MSQKANGHQSSQSPPSTLSDSRWFLLITVSGMKISNWCSIVEIISSIICCSRLKMRRNLILSFNRFVVFLIFFGFLILLASFIDLKESGLFVADNQKEFAPGKIGELCHSDGGGEKRIIFLETSGEKCLRPRQACAVESAALTNPDMTIYVYMALKKPPGNPEMDYGEGLARHCKTMEILSNFSNVYIIYDNISKHLMGTPLESLYVSGQFDNSQYSFQHMSDALRIALLYKYGGIYLDLDVIVLRSLRCLRNTAGHVFILGESSIENGLMAFDRGHKLLNFFMRLMKKTYKSNERSVIGPNGFSRAFRMMCNHSSVVINDSVYDYQCYNQVRIKLLNKTAFHPITYFEQKRFYVENFKQSELKTLENSYSVHVYGSGHGAHVPDTCLFAYMAKQFCPSVYQQHLVGTYLF